MLLRYVYSDELGPFSGRIKTERELHEMATDFGFLDVYVVEVCPDCHWNHLLHTYVLGDGQPRRPLRRPRPAGLTLRSRRERRHNAFDVCDVTRPATIPPHLDQAHW